MNKLITTTIANRQFTVDQATFKNLIKKEQLVSRVLSMKKMLVSQTGEAAVLIKQDIADINSEIIKINRLLKKSIMVPQ